MDRPNWCATVYRVAKSAMTGQLIYTFPIAKSLSRVQLFATPWTVAYEAPLSMEFSFTCGSAGKESAAMHETWV